MARIGNFDITLNKQGWFDVSLADPKQGWFDDTAVGLGGAVDISLSPPGIPSAEDEAPVNIFQIVASPGIGIKSAESQGAPFIAQLIEPPGIPSAEKEAPADTALVVAAPGIASAEADAPGEASTPTPPKSTAAHGGWPATRAPRPTDQNPYYKEWFGEASSWPWTAEAPRPEFQASGENYPWLSSDTSANDTSYVPPPHVGLIDRFGPMKALPEPEFLVAGPVGEQKPWKWLVAGAAVGVGVMWLMNQSEKSPRPKKKTATRRR